MMNQIVAFDYVCNLFLSSQKCISCLLLFSPNKYVHDLMISMNTLSVLCAAVFWSAVWYRWCVIVNIFCTYFLLVSTKLETLVSSCQINESVISSMEKVRLLASTAGVMFALPAYQNSMKIIDFLDEMEKRTNVSAAGDDSTLKAEGITNSSSTHIM